MCNLYRLNKPAADIAHLFGVEATQGANYSEEVYPGYPGLVMAGRRLKVMNWGFPLIMTGRSGQKLKPKPVTNARDDKLSTAFWRASFESRRCLIPVSAWAEPEGEAGQMTRTWYSLPGDDPFAVAGLWRATEEWGDAYTMVMVESSPQMREVHDRMPVILRQDHWKTWIEGSPREAFALCRTWEDELDVEQSTTRWAGRGLMGMLPFE